MESLFVSLLAGTAWPMETPRPYGFFHLALAGLGILLAILVYEHLHLPEYVEVKQLALSLLRRKKF